MEKPLSHFFVDSGCVVRKFEAEYNANSSYQDETFEHSRVHLRFQSLPLHHRVLDYTSIRLRKCFYQTVGEVFYCPLLYCLYATDQLRKWMSCLFLSKTILVFRRTGWTSWWQARGSLTSLKKMIFTPWRSAPRFLSLQTFWWLVPPSRKRFVFDPVMFKLFVLLHRLYFSLASEDCLIGRTGTNSLIHVFYWTNSHDT